jgi:proline racemase
MFAPLDELHKHFVQLNASTVETLQVIDSHTQGEPTRIVVGGLPELQGTSIAEKKQYLEKSLDHLRTAVMLEPRGHQDMFGSFILPPMATGADLGIIFMDSGGYLNMCGHGSMGAVTVAIETGMIKAEEPSTTMVLDTPGEHAPIQQSYSESNWFLSATSALVGPNHQGGWSLQRQQ